MQMSNKELMNVAHFCNSFPCTDLSYEVVNGENFACMGRVCVEVSLKQDLEGRREVGEEGWWVVAGDTETNQLLAIKRVSLLRKMKVALEFDTTGGSSLSRLVGPTES